MVGDCGDILEEQPLLFRTISFLIRVYLSRYRAKVRSGGEMLVFNGLTIVFQAVKGGLFHSGTRSCFNTGAGIKMGRKNAGPVWRPAGPFLKRGN